VCIYIYIYIYIYIDICTPSFFISGTGRPLHPFDSRGPHGVSLGGSDSGLPVPWPWSLIEESAGSGSSDWYREAEVKHGAVAILAAVSYI